MKRRPASLYQRGSQNELCGCSDCCRRVPGRAEAIARQRGAFRRRLDAEFGVRQPRGAA